MRRRLAIWAGALALSAAPLHAQRDSAWTTSGPLLRGRDVATAGAFALASAALMPFDEGIARWFRRPVLQRNAALQHTATVFRRLGSPGALIASVGTYGVGLVAHDRGTADVGLHATEAVAVGSVVGGVMKGVIGRARPFAVSDSDAHDFQLGRGFSGGHAYQSFPSGHATASFALATVLATETRHRSPSSARVVAPVAYGAATLVALSRIYNDDHWASDVAFGAGLGTASAMAVVRYAHGHPHNRVDRRLLPRDAADAKISARDGGIPLAISWTLRF